MATIPQLESYLMQLDRALAGISASEKAEIVMEIKSHVLDAMEKDPGQTVDTILSSLGDPKTVANRFLLERGLKPVKPSVTPFFKWLVIGFLGTVALVFLLFVIILFRFSPIIKVDDLNNRVQILGGLIDIQDTELNREDFKVNFSLESLNVSGSEEIDSSKVDSIYIPFKNSKLDIKFNKDNQLRWDCRLSGKTNEQLVKIEGRNLNFLLDWFTASKCELSIPANLHLSMKGDIGKIVIEKPKSAVDLEVEKGKIQFNPDKTLKYNYDIQVKTGKIDHFESSADKDAIPVRMRIETGKISQ